MAEPHTSGAVDSGAGDRRLPAAPLVSVIIPTYNRVPYLTKALESALAQTYRNTEILVSDNAASREVEDLVASYRDQRLRYRHNNGNVGPLRNVLAGYREARGDYVSTLHDDDIWEPTLLEQLVPPLEAERDLVLAFSDHWVIRADDSVDPEATEAATRRWGRSGLREGAHRPFYRLALVDRAIPIGACVIRRSAIDWHEFPEEVGTGYDMWIAYLASRSGAGAHYCPRRLLRYRWHAGAASASRNQRWRLYCYSRFVADEHLRPIRGDLQRVAAVSSTSLGISLLREGRQREARAPLLRGIARAPELRGVLGLALSFLPRAAFRLVDGIRRTYPHRGLRRVTA
jgi:glycosyltransferase involved in cell wall biosynthesis